MLQWFLSNLATILICTVLLAVVAGIIRHLLRQKKQGKSPCGCGCAGCAMHGACHPQGPSAQCCSPSGHLKKTQ